MTALRRIVACGVLAASGAACGGISPTPRLPESQEYAVGRSMAAETFREHPVIEDPPVHEYVNLVGLYVARFSDRPMTYNDYTFVVIDHEKPNAYAGPSGFVFVTRGLIEVSESEDELAAVLAHEVSHVVRKHPELAAAAAGQVRDRSQNTSFFSRVGGGLSSAVGWAIDASDGEIRLKGNRATAQGSADMAIQTGLLDRAVGKVLETARNGYDREQELQADADGLELMTHAGFDPKAYLTFLRRLERDVDSKRGEGWSGTTHPHPKARIEQAERIIHERRLGGSVDPARTKRFRDAKAALLRSLGEPGLKHP